jgi:hypothetical protein
VGRAFGRAPHYRESFMLPIYGVDYSTYTLQRQTQPNMSVDLRMFENRNRSLSS